MTSNISWGAPDRIADLVGHIRQKGVKLWSEEGRLHYEAPKGALTKSDLENLRACRGAIVSFIEHAATIQGLATPLRRRPSRFTDYIPLTYSQLSHWNLYNLRERHHVRQLASATRIRGRLNVAVLRDSISELLHRHEALRTRVVICNDIPLQQVDDTLSCDIEVDDLTNVSSDRQDLEVSLRIQKTILAPVDVTMDRLFAARLLRLSDDEHVLVCAMEHLISDGISRNILIRELMTVYDQLSNGGVVSLPEMPIQFGDYAIWQRDNEAAWIKRRSTSWSRHLLNCRRLRVSNHVSAEPTATRNGWGAVPIHISAAGKIELIKHARSRATTLVMSVFAVYVALVLRWCGATEAVFRYQTNGRVYPALENIIGFFASALHLRLALRKDSRLGDLTSLIAEEYSAAYQHFDFGRAEAELPRPEFARNSSFNWVPCGSTDDVPGQYIEHAIRWSSIPIGHPMLQILQRDAEPVLLLFDGHDGIHGHILFSLDTLSTHEAERLAKNFDRLVVTLLEDPRKRMLDIELL